VTSAAAAEMAAGTAVAAVVMAADASHLILESLGCQDSLE
jgi:hypothetical protein